MAKKRTQQVRVPDDVQQDIGIIAAAEGISVPDYVERVLREAIIRDIAKAARTAATRAEAVQLRSKK